MTTLQQQMIPTVSGRPVLGHFSAFRSNKLVLFEELSKAGDVVWFWVGPYRILFLNDPNLVRELLVQHGDRLERMNRTNTYLRPFLGEGLLTSTGATHASQRKAVAPHMSPSRINHLGDTIVSLAQDRVAGWEDGSTIDLGRELTTLTLEVIGAALFGRSLSDAWDMLCAAFTHLEEYASGGVNALIPIPPEWPTPTNQRMRRVVAEFDQALAELLAAAQRAPAESGALAPLFQQSMPADMLRDEMTTLLFAGHETTASALTWTMALLDLHPEVAEQLRGEVDGALGSQAPSVAALPALSCLDQILKESMRLYPPAYVLGRNNIGELALGPYLLPDDTPIAISPYTLHRRADVFPDPLRFSPDRWSSPTEVARMRSAYIPFGLGNKSCLGSHFAQMEAQLILATLTQHVSLSLVSGRMPTPEPLVTLRPKEQVLVRVQRRNR